MSAKKCHECGRIFAEGESAWADDWTVLDVSGTSVVWRHEIRLTCDDCEEAS